MELQAAAEESLNCLNVIEKLMKFWFPSALAIRHIVAIFGQSPQPCWDHKSSVRQSDSNSTPQWEHRSRQKRFFPSCRLQSKTDYSPLLERLSMDINWKMNNMQLHHWMGINWASEQTDGTRAEVQKKTWQSMQKVSNSRGALIDSRERKQGGNKMFEFKVAQMVEVEAQQGGISQSKPELREEGTLELWKYELRGFASTLPFLINERRELARRVNGIYLLSYCNVLPLRRPEKSFDVQLCEMDDDPQGLLPRLPHKRDDEILRQSIIFERSQYRLLLTRKTSLCSMRKEIAATLSVTKQECPSASPGREI